MDNGGVTNKDTMISRWHGEYQVNCDLNYVKDRKETHQNGIQEINFKQKEHGKDGLIAAEKDRKNGDFSTRNPIKRVAIIGAGPVGMTSIIQLKDEGIDSVCFEKTARPGGTWCYREETCDGVASIMPTTIINQSKELGAYSTFPPPKEFSNYMRHAEMYRYFMEYWTKNDCLRHVRVNKEVTSVRRAEDYDFSGRWVVTVKDMVTGEVSSEVFDAVKVCIGHINRPKMPSFPGLESFNGRVMHTHTLKGVDDFKDQRVVIVGIGCSALDAAVGISNVAKQVYISTKTGSVIMSRVGPRGYPMDYLCVRRYLTNCLDYFPRSWCSWYIEKVFVEPMFNRKMYNVRPKYPLMSKDPVINDHIGSKLLSGSVIQKGDISHFTERGVVFKGDGHVTEADTIVMATGYSWKFPFLEDGIVFPEEGVFKLYKCTFPPRLKHPTLAIMGFLLVWGPGFPLGEIQSRWVTSVFAGKSRLPSVKKMEKDAVKRYNRNVKGYAPNEKMSIRVDYVQYQDEIASLIGAKPNLTKLFFTDIRLYSKLIFGPSVSYQYRLQGPHKWKGARDAILKCEERVLFPLHRDKVKRNTEQVHANLAYVN